MPPKKKRKIEKKPDVLEGVCVFCGDTEDNDKVYGKMITKAGITVHYFCMLFACGLRQAGETDDDGLLGFLTQDILKEMKRGKRLKCHFCKNFGATIGCSTSSCRFKYHYGCGIQNDVLFQFFGSFSSFCAEHRPQQAAPTRGRLSFKGSAKVSCAICMCAVTARASNQTLRSPCCKNSWFHRECIQEMANNSGIHFFKCPLCNNKELFQEEMLIYGIHIPDQDAAWEMEPNAFQDLLQRPNTCDVNECVCPFGRDANHLETEFEIMRCDLCGSKGTHLRCSNLKTLLDDWACKECTDICGKGNIGSGKKKKKTVVAHDYLEKKFKEAAKAGKKSNSEGKNLQKKSKIKRSLSWHQNKTKKTAKKEKSGVSCEDSNEKPGVEDLQEFLQTSSCVEDSEVSLNISQTSVDSVRDSLLNDSAKVKKTRKPKQSISYNQNIILLDKPKKKFTRLKRAKSMSSLKESENVGVQKRRPRETKRSLKAKIAATEIQESDIANLPRWVQQMHKEDIITGKNLGDQFVIDSPTLNTNKKKKKAKRFSLPNNVIKSVKVKQEPPIPEANETVDDPHNTSGNKDFKQLVITNFISGKKLSDRFATQSSAENKREKLKLKKRKRSSESDISMKTSPNADITNYFLPQNEQQSVSPCPVVRNILEPSSSQENHCDCENTVPQDIKLQITPKAEDKKFKEVTTTPRRSPLLGISANRKLDEKFRSTPLSKKKHKMSKKVVHPQEVDWEDFQLYIQQSW